MQVITTSLKLYWDDKQQSQAQSDQCKMQMAFGSAQNILAQVLQKKWNLIKLWHWDNKKTKPGTIWSMQNAYGVPIG